MNSGVPPKQDIPPDQSDRADRSGDLELTCDGFLGGRLTLRQPVSGHRAGLDAILLAASCPANPGQTVVDLGAGVGTAGLAVACRAGPLNLVLIERQEDLSALSRKNAALNHMADHCDVLCAEMGTPGGIAAAGLRPASADHVIANPPFSKAQSGRASPDPKRRAAHQLDEHGLEPWFKWAAALLREGARSQRSMNHRSCPNS
jgi:tRNA1(Val) A37 N6-methylase TrmN6